MSSSHARRRRGSSATSPRRAARRRRSASSTFAKPAAGRRKPEPRRPRSPRCSRSPGCPNLTRCRASRIAREGRLLIAGPAEAALHWATSLSAASRGHRPRHRPRDRRRAAGRARVSRLFGAAHRAHRLARRVRRGVGAGKSDRSRSVHALQRVHQRVPRACDRLFAIRSISIAARAIASASPRAAPRRRSTSTGATPRARERFDLVLDLERTPHFRMHQPPQGYFAPGSGRRRPGAGGRRARARSPASSRSRNTSRTRRRSARTAGREKPGCNQCIDVCSTAAIAADGDHVKVEPHLCMGCGACATVCPSGAMTYAYPSVPGSRPPLAHAARRLMRKRAGATRACCFTPRTGAMRSRVSRAVGAAFRRA